MSLDKPQPVEALSTSYEFCLPRPPIERVSRAERFDLHQIDSIPLPLLSYACYRPVRDE
jgi:hypothetical protein